MALQVLDRPYPEPSHRVAGAPVSISKVSDAFSTSTSTVDVLPILQAIKQGRWREPVGRIRHLYNSELKRTGSHEEAKKAVKHLKENLPGVMWSGRFTSRKTPADEKLVKHSGLLTADLDGLGEKLPEVRSKLLTSPFLWALFRSPSGDGLKAIFKVRADASQHEGSYRAVERHVLELTGVQIDESGKDVSRLCFMSYDPELYVNANAIEIEPLLEPEKPKGITKKIEQLPKHSKQEIREMLAVIPKRPDYADWIKVVAAVGDALPDAEAIEVLQEWSPEEVEGEYADKLRHRLKDVRVGTLIRLAKQHGWQPPVDLWGPAQPVDCWGGSEPDRVELPPPPVPYVPPPLDLLPSVLQDYVHAAAVSLNVDVAFILLPLLSSLGSAIGNSRSILLKHGFIQPPVVWTGIIGRSGSRKSPSQHEACFAVMEHERELMLQNNVATELYEEEFAAWERKKPRDRAGCKPEKPPFLACRCDDLTIEALADILVMNPRGVLVQKDELSHFFASFDQYKNASGSDVSRWLSLHTAVAMAVDRRTDSRHYRIVNPRVSITGGIQPKILQRVLTVEFFERGLPARFVFAYPPFRQDKWSEATVPDKLRAKVLALFEQLWLLQPDDGNPRLLTLDGDAKAVFVKFYNECGVSALEASEREEAAWSKLPGYGSRFALIGQLTHNPGAEVATGAITEAACELARWSGNEAERIYAMLAETREQREQRELCEFIERRGGVVTVRDVTHGCWRYRNKTDEAERVLSALVRNGFGKWLDPQPGSRGQPARKFQLLIGITITTNQTKYEEKTKNTGDGEAPNSQKSTPVRQPEPNPEKEPSPAPASVPVMITNQMESDLRAMGYSQADINKMTPQQANDRLLTSTSTQFTDSRGQAENSVDVDAYSSQKITPAEQPKIEPVSAKESASEPANVVIGQDPEGETIL